MEKNVNQAVILAGGKGTRLRPLTDRTPKPMVLMNGRPFLEYLIDLLRENGILRIVLLLGYLPEKIVDHFKDGSKFGVRIDYSIGDVSFDTGKRIKMAENLVEDHFLLMYCDNYWPLNIDSLVDYYNKCNRLTCVTVYRNKDGITRNNVLVDENGVILRYDRRREETSLSGVDIGFFIIDKKIFQFMPSGNFSFEKEVLPKLISKKQLCAFMTDHRYYSIGDLERLPITEEFLKPKKIIILDRDGVINKKPARADYVKKWEEFEFLPGAIEAVRILNENGFIVFVVTNQAGIARELMTESDLKNIHNRMKSEMESENAHIERIYYCPHGWDDGCDCRKPRPGMFHQIARDYHVDLTKCIFIGDDERDLEAGDAAGCRTVLVRPGKGLLDIVKSLCRPVPVRGPLQDSSIR